VKGRGFPWLLAAIPATAVGHGLAYVLTGHNQADGHHSYLAPAFGYSIALLIAFCAARLFRALSRSRAPSAAGFSFVATMAQLSLAQVALFTLAERLEGSTPTPIAYAIQIFVALLATIAIAYFTQLERRCERSAIQASEYLRRIRALTEGLRFARVPYSPAYALTISAGTARFQRPPPQL
jgi:hypothetical protein